MTAALFFLPETLKSFGDNPKFLTSSFVKVISPFCTAALTKLLISVLYCSC
jgi:hypothetical protein